MISDHHEQRSPRAPRGAAIAASLLLALWLGACDYSGQYLVRVTNAAPDVVARQLANVLDDPKMACGDGKSNDTIPKTPETFLALGSVFCRDWRSTADIEARFHDRGADVLFQVVAGPGGGLFHGAPDEELADEFRLELLKVLPVQSVHVSQPPFGSVTPASTPHR